MTRIRILTFAAGLMSVAVFSAPASALDLPGTVGGVLGGHSGGAIGGIGAIGGRGVDAQPLVGGAASRLTRTGTRIPDRDESRLVRVPSTREASDAEVRDALFEAGYNPVDGALAHAGLPTTGTAPLAVAVIGSGDAGALASPTPAESTARLVEYQAGAVGDRVGKLAGGTP